MARWVIRITALLATALLAAGGVAVAQPAPQEAAPNPIVAAFREYNAALRANDRPAAIAAGERAWRLSKERDGVGGRTGVLAFNLANTLIEGDEAARALEPARDAEAAIAAGAQGLDPVAVNTMVGLALLESGDRAGRARIEDALKTASPTNALQARLAFLAAYALGAKLTDDGAWQDAARIWDEAARFTPGDGAQARIDRSTVMIFQVSALAQRRQWASAYALAREATDTIAPVALVTNAASPTAPEQVLATARIWETALLARSARSPASLIAGANRQDNDPDKQRTDRPERPVPAEFADRCRLIQLATPPNLSRFSTDQPGGVMMRIFVDRDGKVLSAAVVARVGVRNVEYEESATRLMMMTRVSRDPEDRPDCRLDDLAYLIGIRFR